MTADEMQGRIKYLEGQIKNLQQEVAEFQKDILTLEEGDVEFTSLEEKWGNAISDCYGVVKSNLRKVNVNSGFGSYYLDRFNAILSSREAEEIGNFLKSVKQEAKSEISKTEDKIKISNSRIRQFQNELDELRIRQMAEVE